MAHLLRITAAIASISLCTFLPFFPGRYDSLAVPLSLVSQLLGRGALLLVPVGVLWMASEYRSQPGRRRYGFAISALIVTALLWIFVSFFASTESLTLGIGLLGVGLYVATRLVPRLRSLEHASPSRGRAIALSLMTVPVAVVVVQLALAGLVTEFSRARAIRNSAPLITDIEAHRAANGRYPPSLVSVHPDYKPSVIGIKEYRYEPSGDSYNILFEQATFRLGTREIVMYNPRDEQSISSHALDVIQLTADELALDRTRGHNAVYDARHPHWKYFWFD